MITHRNAALLSVAFVCALACSRQNSSEKRGEEGSVTTQDAEAKGEKGPKPEAAVELKPTQGNKASGRLTLTRKKEGIRVEGTISGLSADGKHGFHVHEKGDCSAPDAASAGQHFNPRSGVHGKEASETHHHLGDMDNLSADSQGNAKVDFVLEGVTLGDEEPTDIIGKSVIVHASPDDYHTQPSGGSGARVACGVITKL